MINFIVADWALKIASNSPPLLERLLERLSPVCHKSLLNSHRSLRELEMNIDIIRNGEQGDSKLSQEELTYDLPRFKYKRRIEFNKSQISVQIADQEFAETNYLYHLGFLFPFSYFLRQHRTTLIHAALVERDGKGTLIVGKSGAGKSSLSIALAHCGFNLYSDEHPLLKLEGDCVVGERFLASPTLRAETFQFLQGVGVRGTPSGYKQKYKISESLKIRDDARSCVIESVLYPEYCEDKTFEMTPVSERESFFNLCKDDYLTLPECASDPDEKRRRLFHIKLLLDLASSTKGYRLRYNHQGLARIIKEEKNPLI